MNYSIEKITQFINAERYGDAAASISFLLTDSRSLCFPEETLFFALRSDRNDGHHYIPELYRRGVRNFVVENVPDNFSTLYKHANFLKVSNTLVALQQLTTHHRKAFDIPVVGITGSNGKTMVKEWLSQLLSYNRNVTRSPKSYNSQIGVPLSVWLLNESSQIGLIEAGISKVGEMQALHDIILPTVGVLTSLGAAHQENFSSLEEKCNEKLLLFKGTQALVYQFDDKIAAKCITAAHYDGQLLAWSEHDTTAAFYVNSIEKHETISTINYIWQQTTQGSYTLPFIDDASISDSITCAVVALHFGVQPDVLAQRMAVLEPVAMRLEVKEGQHGCTLINDSYNSDINSLDIALDFMNRRPDQKRRERTLILSDIYQSGETEQQLYADVAALVKERGVKKFIGIGTALGRQKQAFEGLETKYFFDNINDFIGSKVFKSLHDEVILLKGARSFGFDKLTELLVKKVHETVLEVNLNAVVDNLNWYRSFLKPETKLVCMIKADAYGAGAVEIAKTLQEHRVDYLAVAVADEGATLRRNGITGNIMIMNPEMTSFKTLFDYDLEPEVYSFRLLDALIKAAEKEGITGYPVHIKLDTGMHRLGFNPRTDIDQIIEKLHHQNALIPRSVFSHFVGSDSNDFDSFSARQFALFNEGSKKLQAAFSHRILRHMDNSAGIEHFPERQLDMCRLGLGLYGINPRNNAIMNNVSTLKTTILQLRNVPAGETVGYSRRGIIEKDSVIGAIPIGYADGLNRRLGNRNCYCLVNGKRAYYIGNICMDVALIDVTGIDCEEGDSVEIFGDHLPVTVLSDAMGTIPYEVLTTVSNRVKRVYFQD
ncbi:bifunctional UDP-N-acetylmuramoyl-tripeptide:D-alanyl-D-alanine ligase/alanine racemase [Prevotella nigrescens]|uniref:bifunctional UDP-N-acetylmuramoyl-tripeptide:D-alanyl-D-alanine ligase/alanine racemase n=1 Tax=Prevotella nigrescens TaxID=28133 RepID=UPI001C5CE168|nr:bifunctional UDP-N-acetylmuramoyl-tripeptide:D-alanyl-D-alanine ligase/alanine racemase [Prevotella nigrescens]MBW4726803.1 bifunctional UDP-N-acetylmuramoyl-tripeptide:D-alanyl-D-alanine ligase/alanine racemase [Prevotella nigrescens]